MPLCIGTSLAVIIVTSACSFLAHYGKGAVDVDVLRIWTIPIIVGVVIGIIFASFAKPILFKVVFIVVSKRQIEVALSVYLWLIGLRFFASLN
jgi:uncharacterized protein